MTGNNIRLAALLLMFSTLTSTVFAQPCDCVTTGNCPVGIEDNGTFDGTLDVTVNGTNDLSLTPLQSVCFSITHSWVGDLSVTLTSPNGTNYIIMGDVNNNFGGCGNQADNIDVCIEVGTGNPLTNNTEYICNSGPCQSGTCCLVGNWTMPCGGVTDPISGAVQAPNCDLNDFNTPGSPANGTWTLTVNDVCSSDIGTLDNFTLNFAGGTASCVVCEADGGSIPPTNVTGCVGEPNLNLSLPPGYGGDPPPPAAEYSYAYAITSAAGTILSINSSADMSGQPTGTYQVCGLSYLTSASGLLGSLVGMNIVAAQASLSSSTAPFCADFSTNCITVTIGPTIPPTILIYELCSGDCVTVGGTQFCNSGSVTLTSWLGCDSEVVVTIIPIFPINTQQTVAVCGNDCVTINNVQYCPPGPVLVSLTNWQGCDSIVTLSFSIIPAQAVIVPAPASAVLSCSNPTITLNGTNSLPLNATYLWAGPGGFSSAQGTVSVSMPGTYTLTVSNNSVSPPCTSFANITITGSLSPPDLQLLPAAPSLCAGQSLNLTTLNITDLNNTNPVITFHSATPPTPANVLPGTTVSPTVTTTYYALGTTGNCTDILPITVTVTPAPTATFTVTSPICQTANSTVTFTGTAGAGATLSWNFGGGTAVPGTGAGPHLVSWSTPGPHTVTLTVTQNGCTSTLVSHTVQVDAPLAQPAISCGTVTTSSVEFLWNNVAGATGYNVTVNSGPTGTQSGNSYTVTGLSAGQSVQITVTATGGGACGNSSATLTCTAQNCPPVTLNISPVADICLVAGGAPTVDLNVVISGGTGNGVQTWSGMGITNALTGIFDPNIAGAGTHSITLTYVESGCTYINDIDVDVFALPSASFTVTSPICEDGASTVTYTGNAGVPTGVGTTFTWGFGGGTATPGTGAGPHTVEWATSGPKTITLLVSANGCNSPQATQTVQVDEPLEPPVVNCNTSVSSIEFTWNPIAGATSYVVTVNTGQTTGAMNSATSYEVTGLSPNEVVEIEVTALSINSCPASSTVISCTAQNCAPVTVSITPVAPICNNGNTAPFLLIATQTGGVGGGTFTWSGTGVSNLLTGQFNPAFANAGANTIVATYTEGTCTYNASLVIFVYPVPTATFTATSPICETGSTIVNYTGTASSSANFTWNFGGGTAVPGTGAGPHTVTSFPIIPGSGGGAFAISLTVEENGCTSAAVSHTVSVGELLPPPVITCNPSTSTIEFVWNEVPGAAGYDVFVNGGTSTSDTSWLVTGLNPGDQVTIEVVALSAGACGNSMAQQTCTASDCVPLNIVIDPVSDFCLSGTVTPATLSATITGGTGNGTQIWSGSGVTGNTFNPMQANIGANTVTLTYEEGNCLYTEDLIINVFDQPVASFTVQTPVCEGEPALVTYTGNVLPGLTYNWNFNGGIASPGVGQGPHNVTWATDGNFTVTLDVETFDGCASDPFSADVQVDEPLVAPNISCLTTTGSIQFNWTDVANATETVAVIAGQAGTQSGSSYLVSSLVPGDSVTIELTVSASGGCPPVMVQETCVAQDCPLITIDVPSVAPICLIAAAPSVQVTANVSGSNGSGSGTWSGNGVTPSGFFSPADAGVGQHVLVFTFIESNCPFEGSVTVEVNASPTADFSATATICESDFAAINYTGNASSSATYNWNFGGGSATPGSGSGPQQVTWTTPGSQTVSLSVTENGCTSAAFTQDVQVDSELELPVITCNASTNFVEFSWNTVPGGTDYDVSSSIPGTQNGSVFTVNGLQSGDAVTIELTVSGNTACPPVTVEQTCNATDCVPVSIVIEPVGPLCLLPNSVQEGLTATVTGVSGGTGIWSGTGVTGNSFNPLLTGAGSFTITYTYQLDNCSWSENLQIEVAPAPVANAGQDAFLTCQEDEMSAELGSNNSSSGANISYDWTANSGAFPGDSTSLHPEVSAPGIYTLTVTNDALQCSASDVVEVTASQAIPMPAISIKPVSCFEENDAAIAVDTVIGGLQPYLFSLNGGTFSASGDFPFLTAGVYTLTVMDAAGCENTVTLDIQQPQALNVELVLFLDNDNVVRLGDSARIAALITIPFDSLDLIQWEPDSLVNCDTCLEVVIHPTEQTTYSIMVESNGCRASDATTIFVRKDRPVFVPNAFSPNGDGTNDFLSIFAGSSVTRIKSFLVFDRWGETVWQYEDFLPNDPAAGWNGTYRGKSLNPAVFTWFAEIEFIDGVTEVLEGDVSIVR